MPLHLCPPGVSSRRALAVLCGQGSHRSEAVLFPGATSWSTGRGPPHPGDSKPGQRWAYSVPPSSPTRYPFSTLKSPLSPWDPAVCAGKVLRASTLHFLTPAQPPPAAPAGPDHHPGGTSWRFSVFILFLNLLVGIELEGGAFSSPLYMHLHMFLYLHKLLDYYAS